MIVETAELLLDRGAEVEQQHYLGTTALHWAALRGREDLLEQERDRETEQKAAKGAAEDIHPYHRRDRCLGNERAVDHPDVGGVQQAGQVGLRGALK